MASVRGFLAFGALFLSSDSLRKSKKQIAVEHEGIEGGEYGPNATVHDRFLTFDKDGNGYVTVEELQHRLEETLSPEQLDAFRRADADGNGVVDEAEYEKETRFCVTGCCSSTCGACVAEIWTVSGGCRWCANAGKCRNIASLLKECDVGINSAGQCWSDICPRQQGHFLPMRTASAREWATRSAADAVKPMEPYPVYPAGTSGMFDLTSGRPLRNARDGNSSRGFVIGAASDWGSATCESKVVADLIGLENPGMTIHLGDIYYNARPEEVDMAVAGIPPENRYSNHQIGVNWPKGSVTTFLANANHEMLSGGKGYYENGFAYTGQQAAYGVWQSDHWRFVALDTGYTAYTLTAGARNLAMETDAPQPELVFKWLRDVVKLGDPADKRGIVLMSHHQPYDAWKKVYLGTLKQLNSILPAGKSVVWFFGHAHNFAVYDHMKVSSGDFTADISFYGRLVGHGGYPVDKSEPKEDNFTVFYDNRHYQSIPMTVATGSYHLHKHGYFKMEVTGPRLDVSYISAKCKAAGCDHGYHPTEGEVVAKERFTVDMATGKLGHSMSMVHEEMTPGQAFSKVVSRSAGDHQQEPVVVKVDDEPTAAEDCPAVKPNYSPETTLCGMKKALGGRLP